MKRVVYGAVLVAALLFLVGCMVSITTDSYGDVQGYVFIPEGSQHPDVQARPLIATQSAPPSGYEPLVNAKVWVDSSPSNAVWTRGDGSFYIRNVRSGSRTIYVSHTSLRENVKAKIEVRPGRINQLNTPLYAGIGYYIIIGIGDYPYYSDEYQYGPWADANLVADRLFVDNHLAVAYAELLLDRDATKQEIKRLIKQAAKDADPRTSDYLVFYFSGMTGPNMIYPSDYKLTDGKSVITDVELEGWLREFPGDVTVIIDGESAATLADGIGLEPLALKEDPYYTLIAAASEGESVVYDSKLGNSVFTYFFVQGLGIGSFDDGYIAPADANVDGDITAVEMFNYVKAKMYEYFNNNRDPDTHVPVLKRGSKANTVLFRY